MPPERLTPTPFATVTIKERKREVLIDLIEQWKQPYPQGLGDGMDFLLDEMVTKPGKTLDTMYYADFTLLFQIIEERYREMSRQKQLTDEKRVGPQEPPDDPRIFNRRQADGTFRPIKEFFEPWHV